MENKQTERIAEGGKTTTIKLPEHYQVMIVDENGKKLAYKKDNVWTINATTEEILDAIFKVINPQNNDN